MSKVNKRSEAKLRYYQTKEGKKRRKEHAKNHSVTMKALHASKRGKEVRAKITAGQKAHYQTKEGKQRAKETSKRSKRLWKDPKFLVKQKNFLDPKLRKERMEKRWKDKKFKAKMLIVRKEQVTEEWKEWNRKRIKALWADPVYRAKQMASRKASKKYQNKGYTIAVIRRENGTTEPWNKGYTKETHPSVKACSDKLVGRVPNRQSPYLVYQRGKKIVPMRSWWEVAYAEYLDSQRIKWEYEPRFFSVGKSKKWRGTSYTPDFYIVREDRYVEIKGLEPKQFKCKFRRFKNRYPDIEIEILKGKDLKKLEVLDVHGKAVLSVVGRRNRKKYKRRQPKY